jgi:hypothetical protein
MTSTTSTSVNQEKDNRPPAGAKIVEKSVRTETEEIENGYLTTKSYSGRYITKGSSDTYGNYYNYSKKWYTKEDPLTITINDKSLAEAFEAE